MSQKFFFTVSRCSVQRNFTSCAKLFLSPPENPSMKDVPMIDTTTWGREASDKVKDARRTSWQEFYFLFFFFITFCIKLKSFFSLQHTLSCDVKEVKRVGQKTLWHHNILQAYKVQKVEKRVALRLTAVCYNNGDGQKKAHTKKPLRPQQPSQSHPIHWTF